MDDAKPLEIGNLEVEGRVWIRDALSETDLVLLDNNSPVERGPGVRLDQLDQLSGVLGSTGALTRYARQLLPNARPVRVVVFNKTSEMNWQVAWHQDRVIAVRQKHQVSGYDNWSKKSGTWHVEPPIDFLENMIFARVHLDDTDEKNGCLELAVGSHKKGRVNAGEAATAAASSQIEICNARRSDVLFVKALTLHRSKPSQAACQRRTLRVDYCGKSLPEPLQWVI